MIERLVGLFEVRTTERYARLAADWVTGSAARVSESVSVLIFAADIRGQPRKASGDVREGVTDNVATERRCNGVVGESFVDLSGCLYASKRVGHCHGSGPFRP